MNRSILIVICDFLLVSLLAFSTVDINKATEDTTPRVVKVDLPTNQVDSSGKDLAAEMRLALDEERHARDQLMGELAKAREAASKQQLSLSEREKQFQTVQQQLQAREQQLQKYQQDLQTREQQAQLLRQAQAALEQQFATAQTNIQALSEQVRSSTR